MIVVELVISLWFHSVSLLVTIGDVNDNSPQFSRSSYQASIPENTQKVDQPSEIFWNSILFNSIQFYLLLRKVHIFQPIWNIPDICHEHHERCSCKFFLAGVNFYRFNAKNWHFRHILREKVAFFTDLTRKYGVFRCKFYSPKILPV